ncbi:MAG: hypothetical protein LBM04_09235 [Opitutaceae bacterium]|jgi:hypothetical protein|nr:hypothetical protein [Opitutaceae bacterium]
MNSSKIIIACVCCALAGGALGFGLGRMGAGGTANRAEKSGGAGDSKDSKAANGRQGSGKSAGPGELYPGIAGLKTVAEWRGYLERWIAAECPEKNLGHARECLRRWAEQDADAALAFVHASPRFTHRNSAYAIPLGIIGRTQMPRVIEWLRQNLSEVDRNHAGECVIGDIMRDYPEQAMELAVADQIPVSEYFFSHIIQMMAQVSLEDARRMFVSLPDNEKAAAAGGFAVALARSDARGAVEWCLQQQGKPYAQSAFDSVLRTIAQTSPSELPALVERFGSQLNDDILRSSMYYVTSLDPAIALDVLQKLPAEKRQRYGNDVVLTLFTTDADQAVAAARVLLPESGQFDQIYRGYELWAYSDRKAAEAWLDSEADAGLREQIRMKQMAQGDPMGFLSSVNAVADDSFTAQRIDEALKLAGEDKMPEAVNWLLANPGQITGKRLRQLGQMTRDGVPITLPDISAMPDGAARQTTINYFSDEWVNSGNWNNAAELIPMMADARKQDALRFKIFTAMMRQPAQRESARQWLATQPLSAEVRASWESLTGAATTEGEDDEVIMLHPFPVH